MTLVFMMNLLRKSLSIEIVNFVDTLKKHCDFSGFKIFTKSAFSQCRKKIQPEVFNRLNDILVKEFYTDNAHGVELWNGYRVLGVDGSTIKLPFTQELEEIYGVAKNHTNTVVVKARASVLYDVLNKYVIDGLLSPLETGERDLALEHLTKLTKSKVKDLIIYDRGYPSYDFIYEHFKRNLDYLIRVSVSYSSQIEGFVASGNKSEVAVLFPGVHLDFANKDYDKDTGLKARLIRVDLPTGETEVLISSLLDEQKYPHGIFKELYFKRWTVETFYDELKNKLKVEHFSGYSNTSILQDFNAAIFISNVQTLIVGDLKEEIAAKTKDNQFGYKVNTNLSYGFLKNRIISLFLSDKAMNEVIVELKDLFKIDLVPIKPNRSNTRNTKKFLQRKKPIITKNYKDAI